jgi:hypothetical protein
VALTFSTTPASTPVLTLLPQQPHPASSVKFYSLLPRMIFEIPGSARRPWDSRVLNGLDPIAGRQASLRLARLCVISRSSPRSARQVRRTTWRACRNWRSGTAPLVRAVRVLPSAQRGSCSEIAPVRSGCCLTVVEIVAARTPFRQQEVRPSFFAARKVHWRVSWRAGMNSTH